MSGEADYVDVHYPTFAAGLRQWNATASTVSRVWHDGVAKIRELHARHPWGQDSAGQAFAQVYMQNGGPEALFRQGGQIIQTVVDLGPTARKAIENTHGTDEHHGGDAQSIAV